MQPSLVELHCGCLVERGCSCNRICRRPRLDGSRRSVLSQVHVSERFNDPALTLTTNGRGMNAQWQSACSFSSPQKSPS
eukprot:scaffold130466_cov72-Phaeocystis_antarctica.AAC.3